MNLLRQQDVIVGFRPEYLLPAEMFPADARIPMRFRVAYVEYLGSERILYGSLVGSQFEGQEVISRLPSRIQHSFAPETVVEFAVPENQLKFFDATTEKRAAPKVLAWR
jgi:multiple sugar transport system ATP-binding protein